jgi:hypothetical protein
MRKTLATLLALGIVLVGYTAWPLYDLFVLLRAIEASDIGTVTQHVYSTVSVPRLRTRSSPPICAAPAPRSVRARGKWPPLAYPSPSRL